MAALTALLLAASLQGGVSATWSCFRLEGHHGPTLACHDTSSGVLARIRLATREPWYSKDKGARVRAKGTVAVDSGYADYIELREPAADVQQLAADIGQEPSRGSFTGALLDAFRPPPTCAYQIEYRISQRPDAANFVSATVCSADQRSRLDAFVQLQGWSQLVPAIDTAGADKVTLMTEAEFERMLPGLSLNAVLQVAGGPSNVWPRYPTGLTLTYPAHSSAAASSFAIDIGLNHVVEGTRRLLEDVWSQ